jgi:hypothetical protein
VLAAIHRLLRSKHQRLRPQITDFGFDRERHGCSLVSEILREVPDEIARVILRTEYERRLSPP